MNFKSKLLNIIDEGLEKLYAEYDIQTDSSYIYGQFEMRNYIIKELDKLAISYKNKKIPLDEIESKL